MAEARDNLAEALTLFFETAPEEEMARRIKSKAYATQVEVAVGWAANSQACRILSAHGFEEVRRRGSHVVMQKADPDGTTTAPVPDHAELRIGTLMSIIRQSGVPRSEFK